MKRVFVSMLVVFFVFAMANSVSAQDNTKKDGTTTTKTCCKKAGDNTTGSTTTGGCQGKGQANGTTPKCSKFVDANNDGKCDNCVNGTCTGTACGEKKKKGCCNKKQ